MAINHGSFVISLDFELMWGVRDVVSKQTYGQHILGEQTGVPKILDCFSRYKIKSTFAVVGFLFFRDKESILAATPSDLPSYTDANLSPYGDYMKSVVGENDMEDPYHFGRPLVEKIKAAGGQEIGTHTFCHYYCLESGQTQHQFREDLRAAIATGRDNGCDIKTIIFPRNQVNEAYLNVCREEGIVAYRGTEDSWIYSAKNSGSENLFRRFVRLMDAYINLSGHHCHDYAYMAASFPFNIPSSRFLRPYSKKFRWFESLRLRRIKKSMTHAAKNNLTYHLWWHPHNFGINQDQNICFLESILDHYKYLNGKYAFASITMKDMAAQLAQQYGTPQEGTAVL